MPRLSHPVPSIMPAYTGRLFTAPIPALRLPDEAIKPEAAYRFIHDELMLDGSSRLNLATFVTTWMGWPGRSMAAPHQVINLTMPQYESSKVNGAAISTSIVPDIDRPGQPGGGGGIGHR
jgi:glutamate/tyrosine decarboxylase-like PLP-dependent enzyme